MARILSVGLTGGIGSGKSSAAQRMAEHGAIIIDADLLARQVVAPGSEGLAEIVDAFGAAVLTSDGTLDRQALGEIVFADETARSRLNSIIHPRVRAESRRRREAAEHGSIVVEDIPLLVDTGQQDRFDEVVVIYAPVQERIRRLTEDRGMSQEEAESRIDSQVSDVERHAAATVVVDNSTSKEQLEAQIDRLMTRWQSDS